MSETVSSEIPFFTLGEAAKQAGVSKPTLSKAIKTGIPWPLLRLTRRNRSSRPAWDTMIITWTDWAPAGVG